MDFKQKQELINLLIKINIEERYINLIDAYLKVENDTNQIITFIKRYIKMNSQDHEIIRNYLYYLNSTSENDTFMGLYNLPKIDNFSHLEAERKLHICPICNKQASMYADDGGTMMCENNHKFHMCNGSVIVQGEICEICIKNFFKSEDEL